MNIKVYSVIVALNILFLQWLLITRPCHFFSTTKNDEDFLLGGKGYGVEFCDAIGVIISLDIFLALNYFIDLWSDQFSESRMASSQIWGRHGCSEKQPLTTLFCRVECLYLLVRCMKIPKKWLLIKYLFSLRPVHAMELMQMKPV